MKNWWANTFNQGLQTLTIPDANGNLVEIAYGEKGTGIPIILLHGIASWSYSWRYCIEPLSQQFRTICFDAKGHGFSEKPLPAEKTGHQVIELIRFIEALCDEPVIVVAQSLGALVALAAVEIRPELFLKLIVINVPIFPKELPYSGMRLLSRIPLNLIQLIDKLRLSYLFANLVRLGIRIGRQEVVVDGNITAEDVYGISYPYVEFAGAIAKLAEDLQQAAIEIEKLKLNQPNLISDIQNNLQAIAIPTLILWSEQDRWFDVSNGEKLHSHLPNSRFQILPNCGHDAAAGCPQQVVWAVLSFLTT